MNRDMAKSEYFSVLEGPGDKLEDVKKEFQVGIGKDEKLTAIRTDLLENVYKGWCKEAGSTTFAKTIELPKSCSKDKEKAIGVKRNKDGEMIGHRSIDRLKEIRDIVNNNSQYTHYLLVTRKGWSGSIIVVDKKYGDSKKVIQKRTYKAGDKTISRTTYHPENL